MKTVTLVAGALALSLLGTGCATKKYVAKTIAPVESRVTGTETKNTEQDKMLAGHTTQIEEMDRDLSRTKEKLTDTDAKAVAAGAAAKRADEKADGAARAADGAAKSADGARGLAEKGIERTVQLERTVDAMNKYQMLKTETVLFAVGRDTLTTDGKAQLDELAKSTSGLDRYVIEVQGFTDKSGAPSYNETLSERRAQSVARYLANEYKIPVRSISMLGSGWAQPVADDKTREGRKMNRRVEVRLFVPQAASAAQAVSAKSEQEQ